MTVAAGTPLALYDGDGVTVAFPAPWRYLDPAHLVVELVASDGLSTPLALVDDYTATAGNTDSGGMVTVAVPPAYGERLRLRRATPRAQPTAYPTSGAFPARSHELALDRQMLAAQDIGVDVAELQERTPQVAPGQTAPMLDMANIAGGQVLALVGGKIAGVDNDPASAADSAAVAVDAKDIALDATALALAAQAGAVDAALSVKDYYPAARSYVPQGAVIGAATISTAGSGGTNGTFALAFTGGNFGVNPTGTFTVAGGAVTAIAIDGAGLYVGGAISKPTLSFAASAGLTGAAGTYASAYLKTAGQYYLTDHASAANKRALFQNQDNAAVEINANLDWLDVDTLAALAASAVAAANSAAASALQGRMRIDDKTTYTSVSPAAAWNGTAGTGFGAAPADPARTTAKPACRLIVPPNQYFTDFMVVGVVAGANNAGALDNFGLGSVIVHYEGSTATIKQPSFYSFPDANGKTVSYFGWWAVLLHNGTNGHARVYFEAVPKDQTMQRRVIGPFQFSPAAAVHDASLTVAASGAIVAGVSYQALDAALDWCRLNSKHNPLITITEGGTYDLAPLGASYEGQGRAKVKASVPVVIQRVSGAAQPYYRPRYTGIHMQGANITLDFIYASEYWNENTGGHTRALWLDGINIVNSAGRYHLPNGNPRNEVAWLFRGSYWQTECRIDGLWHPGVGADLVRGCHYQNCWADLVNGAVVIDCTVDGFDSSEYRAEISAFSVTYTGVETTATLALSGSNNAVSRTMTAKYGATTTTLTILNTTSVQSVVDWLNTLTGWSATFLNGSRRANLLTKAGTLAGGAFGDTNCKSVTFTPVTMVDVHSDFAQHYQQENFVISGNVVTNSQCQNIFFKDGFVRDALVLNNAFHNTDAGLQSQFASVQSHVVIAHNSWATQQVSFRTDFSGTSGSTAEKYQPDAYCLFVNNVAPIVTWATTVDADLLISNNHLFTGSTAPSGSTGTTIDGDATSLWQSAATGDFTPKGALLTNLKLSLLGRDYLGRRRSKADAAGAAV